jgi:2-methylcitrate dehydratase PrpD
VQGEVNLATFRDSRVGDPRVKALMARIVMEADDRVRHDPEFATAVEVELEDGTRLEELVPLAMGKPSRWFDKGRLRAKLADCMRHAAPATPDAAVAAMFDALLGMDTSREVTPLLARLERRLVST